MVPLAPLASWATLALLLILVLCLLVIADELRARFVLARSTRLRAERLEEETSSADRPQLTLIHSPHRSENTPYDWASRGL